MQTLPKIEKHTGTMEKSLCSLETPLGTAGLLKKSHKFSPKLMFFKSDIFSILLAKIG